MTAVAHAEPKPTAAETAFEHLAPYERATVTMLASLLESARGHQLRLVWELAFALRDSAPAASAVSAHLQEIGSLAMRRDMSLANRNWKGEHRAHLSAGLRRAVARARCAYCGRDREPLEHDHITPVSAGADDAVENIALACRTCNRRKGDASLADFLAKERVRRRAEADALQEEARRLDDLYAALVGAAA